MTSAESKSTADLVVELVASVAVLQHRLTEIEDQVARLTEGARLLHQGLELQGSTLKTLIDLDRRRR